MSERETRKKSKIKDLGDIMGLAPPPSDASSPQSPNTEGEEEEVEYLENLEELAQMEAYDDVNSFPSPEQGLTDNVYPTSKDIDFPEPYSIKEGPVLWMLEPHRYPQVLESFRILKNRVVRYKEDKNLKIFLMTGAEKKVGTSTVTFNLGVVLARDLVDQRVLLVDTNLSNPSLHSTFGLSSIPGLMDCLLDNLPWHKTIQPSFISNLDLLPVGRTEGKEFSPFDLKGFPSLLEKLRNRYQYILFDSVAPFKSSETRIVSLKVDGVIIVVEANKTRWEVVNELKRQLESDGANVMGSFLNKRRFVIPSWVYNFI